MTTPRAGPASRLTVARRRNCLKITCSRDELAARLGVVARGLSTRGTVQILAGVLLQVQDGADGKHNANLLHEGPFTTTSSFCPSGYAADVTINDVTLTAVRKFTCSDSGADFTARIAPLSAEHGGSGTWQIVDGTGPLAELRGKGIWKSERLSGGPDPGSITFRSTWDGVADFGTDSPEIAISKPTARKLPRPAGSYALHMTLGFADAAGTVSYLVLVYDARKPLDPIGSKSGESRTAGISATLRVRPKQGVRTLRIHVDATDPYGNHSALTRSNRLR